MCSGVIAECISVEMKNMVLMALMGLETLSFGYLQAPATASPHPFVNSVDALLDLCRTSNLRYYFFGDFNVHFQRYLNAAVVSELINAFLSNSIFSLVNCPTRISKNSCSIIDNIFTNGTAILLNSTTNIISDTTSDHFPVLLIYALILMRVRLIMGLESEWLSALVLEVVVNFNRHYLE